jgi:DNA-directed RNA polymerase subunit M/transcription elongation factor TFIIS
MKFCPNCENYLNMKIEDNSGKQTLNYFCRNCAYSQSIDDFDNDEGLAKNCILKNDYNIQKLSIEDKILENLFYDKTIPHINNISCPNRECDSNKEMPNERADNDIIYIMSDFKDMKYLYICKNCRKRWTNN